MFWTWNWITGGSSIPLSNKYSKLKYSVPEFLKSNSDLNQSILKIEVASDQDGGEGAILVKLKIL